MVEVTTALYGHRVVRPAVVTPSMSGKYVMPLLRAYPTRLRALVAVAPVAVDLVPRYKLAAMASVRTLVVWGERDDAVGGRAAKRLLEIPGSESHVIKGAGHACYVDNPDEFHAVVGEFLRGVDRPHERRGD